MRKLLSRLLVLSMTAVAFVSTSNVAEAKVYNYDLTEESFDAADYANRYADLKAAFGEDKAALYNHYKYFGAEEGRGDQQECDAQVLDPEPDPAVARLAV